MKTPIIVSSSLLLFIASLAALSSVGATKKVAPKGDANSAQVERGRYIVHSVGLCIDCHSPRGPDGEFIESKHLTGSPLPFVATVPMPWASLAPRLAGLPINYTKEALVRFLMTGERPNGLPPSLPPMPSYRMNEEDATAVAAYIETLKTNL